MTRRARVHTREQLVTHFWLAVQPGDAEQCWPWTGYAEGGYGRYFDGERMRFAHDLALEWWSGEKRAPTLQTCHSCNNPICCNPHHLRFDTAQSNVDDMMAAGRQVPGGKKLSDDDVRTIRERRLAGATGRALALQYGVSGGLITTIIQGKRRASAGGPIQPQHGNTKHGRYSKDA